MALEQHPVPQQISSYQFRLVGDMTLKQFLQLAAGAGIGLLIYGSPLPTIIKWPLVIFFVIAGAAFAFLPVQDRPLSAWLSAFFKAIYSPTIYIWKREEQSVYFAPEEGEIPSLSESGENTTSQGDIQAKFGEIASGFLENLEGAEERYLSKVTGILKSTPDEPAVQSATFEQPKILNEVTPTSIPVPRLPNEQIVVKPPVINPPPMQPVPATKVDAIVQPTTTLQSTPVDQVVSTPLPIAHTPVVPQSLPPVPVIEPEKPQEEAPYYRPIPKPPAEMGNITLPPLSTPSTPTTIPVVNVNNPVMAPTTVVSPLPAPIPVIPAPPSPSQSTTIYSQNTEENIPKPIFQEIAENNPTQLLDLKMMGLETPTQANILVGKVMDSQQNPVSNVIMEIKDEFGRPVRALKTDKDGRFRIVTPLHDGNYTIYAEKDNLEFEPIQITLQDTIVEPMIVEPKK